jgi:hypothetical protein
MDEATVGIAAMERTPLFAEMAVLASERREATV